MHTWLRELLRFAWSRRGPVLIDGRSGAGKTTLGEIVARSGPGQTQLVHLDDLYRGWFGLEDASRRTVSELLGATREFSRWDWEHSRLGERISVPARAPLVIEGSGAITRASCARAAFTIWVDAPEPLRRYRALRRDGAGYADGARWDLWQAQEQRHVYRDHPDLLADVQLTWGGTSPVHIGYHSNGMFRSAQLAKQQ